MAPNVTISFWAPDDINGTPVLTIDDEDPYFKALKLTPDLYGLGGWELTLSRTINFGVGDNGATRAEAFVRFMVHAYSDTDWYWGGFVQKRQMDVVDRDELGAEEFVIGGPGPKAYLDRYRLGIEQNVSSDWNIDLENGVWRWAVTAPAGKILRKVIAEDEASTPVTLVDMTQSFDGTDDSDSVPWANDIAGPDNYETPIGSSLLQILWDLEDLSDLFTDVNLGTLASPVYELNAYQTYGQDVSSGTFGMGVCLLREGVNIANESLTVEGVSIREATHVIVEGKDAAWATEVKSSWNPGDYVKWGKIEVPRSSNIPVLERAGLRWLRRQENGDKQITVEVLPGDSEATGLYFPKPGGVMWLGNIITLDTSADGTIHYAFDYNNEDQLLTGIELSLGPAGDDSTADKQAKSWDVKVKLNHERAGFGGSPDQSSSGTSPGNGQCTKCRTKPHFAPECPENPGDSTLIDWDWTDCSNPSYVDPFDASSGNPWGGGFETLPGGADGCGTQTNHNTFSDYIAVDPGDVIHVSWWATKYGAGSPAPANFRVRWYEVDGDFISDTDAVLTVGTASHEHGTTVLQSQADFTAPANAQFFRIGQTTWSLLWTQHVTVTVAGDPPDDIGFCVDHEDFPHDSPYSLPSDYIEARFDSVDDYLATLKVSSLTDVDLSDLADGDVLVWDETLELWVPSGGGGGGGVGGALRWYNVETYGAVHDGVTDDTAAIQAAIDAWDADGRSGIIFFPMNTDKSRAVYLIDGALQDTGTFNSQLEIPQGSSGEVTFLGPAVLRSTWDDTISGNPSVISFGTHDSLTLNQVFCRFENMVIQVPVDPGLSGIDATKAATFRWHGLQIETNGTPTVVPTNTNTVALDLPYGLNDQNSGGEDLYVTGFYTAIRPSEQMVCQSVYATYCARAVEMRGAEGSPEQLCHSATIQRLNVWNTVRGIVFTGDNRTINVELMDVEHDDPAPFATIYDIDDASNFGRGFIRWHTTDFSSGAAIDDLLINGGTGLSLHGGDAKRWRLVDNVEFPELGSDPATPASGTRTLYAKSDGFYEKDDGGTVTGPFGSGGSSGGVGPILIADVHSTPLIFGDLLQTEAGDDLLYGEP